jgi:DNA-binding SARP family transcriptional activator
MLEFRTLGKLELWGEDGHRIETVLPYSKRLSLLAYLCASHPPRLHRRDTLIALFWPELDGTHARGALRQELSRLRHALGRDVILGEGSEAVGVDAARLWCDAAAFEAALHAGELSSALGLFGGEFLPGLHVDGGEFDRWLDGARDSLRRHAVDAARSLSAEAELAGDLARAVDSARRLTELALYDETGWQRLITLLDLCGDRAGALTAYDTLATRLKADLELEPSPETQALSERIRSRVEAFSGTASPTGMRDLRTPARGPLVVIPAGMVAVRILPVENQTGDARHDVMARWLTDRLARWISELYWVHLADEQRVRARVVVSGSLRADGEMVEVRTRLAEPGGGAAILAAPGPVSVRTLADTASLDTLIARVVATLAARYHPRVAVPPGIPAPFRPPSYEAFLWYLTGSELFGEFRFAEAAANLRKAYELDPTFVKAAQFAAIALAWGGDPAAAESLATAAMAANQPLPDYERYFGQWILASLRGRREEAYRNARETARLSSHPLLQGILAWESMRHGRAGEVVRTMLAVEDWGIGWWRNWTNIAEAHAAALHVLGDHTTELSAVLSRRAVISESFDLIRAEIRARSALGQPVEVLRLVEEAQTIPPSHTTELPPAVTTPADIAWVAAQELDHHGQPRAARGARGMGLAWLQARGDPTRAEQLLHARLLMELGDAVGAQRILDALAPLDDPWSLGLAGLVAAARGDTVTAGRVVASLQAIDNPYLAGLHLLEAAGVQAAMDQADAAVATLRDARARGLPYGVELHALPMLRPLVGRSDFADLLRPRG